MPKVVKMIKHLQIEICYLSLIGVNQKAIHLIQYYSFNILLRYYSINKVVMTYKKKKINKSCNTFLNTFKIKCLHQSKKTKLNLYIKIQDKIKIKFKKKKVDKKQKFIMDKILQIQFQILFAPFYEAKYPQYIYVNRKNRRTYQIISGILHAVRTFKKKTDRLICVNIAFCLTSKLQKFMFQYFKMPFL